jgi:tRNA dimethylallyltransferase
LIEAERTIRAIEIAEDINATDWQWPTYQGPLLLGLKTTRETNRHAITERLKHRLENGMIEEVARLHRQGIDWSKLDFFGLEYRFIAQHLQGQLRYNDMFQKLNSAIHQFAKQQEKWFRRIEERGHRIHWFESGQDNTEAAREVVVQWLADNEFS